MKYTPVRVLMTEFADSSKGDKMLVNGYMYTQKAVKRNRVCWEGKIENNDLL